MLDLVENDQLSLMCSLWATFIGVGIFPWKCSFLNKRKILIHVIHKKIKEVEHDHCYYWEFRTLNNKIEKKIGKFPVLIVHHWKVRKSSLTLKIAASRKVSKVELRGDFLTDGEYSQLKNIVSPSKLLGFSLSGSKI